jgi:hypothetical protein
MDKKMKIDVKILNEVMRYKSINNYISEQDATLPPPPDAGAVPPPPDAGAMPPPDAGAMPPPDAGAVPPPPDAGAPESVDISTDPDVEKIGGESKKSKELDITDLVKSQQSVEKKQEEYFDNLFKHLEGLESKLSDMDSIMNKLNDLETKVEKYRVKTPEEKLELRSLDSGPFNQKLTDFFEDKQEDMEKSGKNEYVLTKDDVESYSPGDIKKSFRNFENTDTDIDTFSRLK